MTDARYQELCAYASRLVAQSIRLPSPPLTEAQIEELKDQWRKTSITIERRPND